MLNTRTIPSMCEHNVSFSKPCIHCRREYIVNQIKNAKAAQRHYEGKLIEVDLQIAQEKGLNGKN